MGSDFLGKFRNLIEFHRRVWHFLVEFPKGPRGLEGTIANINAQLAKLETPIRNADIYALSEAMLAALEKSSEKRA